MRTDSRLLQMAWFSCLTLLILAIPEMAWAQVDSLGQSADHIVNDSDAGLRNLLTGFAYLAGAMFGVRSAVLLRDHTENPGNVRLSKPLMAGTVSTALLALPGVYSMLAESVGFATGDFDAFGAMFGTQSGAPTSGAGNLDQVAQAFSSSIPGLMRIVSWGAIMAGGFLLLRSIFMLPNVEQGRESPSKVLWTMTSGIGLWSLLPMVNMIMGTQGAGVVDSETILTSHYSAAAGGGGAAEPTIHAVLAFFQFIGLIAFVRGTLILKALGENKDGAMGRALTHILGGAAAMNISWTVGILAKSIGADATICTLGGAIASICT